jgi:hypothetical protein
MLVAGKKTQSRPGKDYSFPLKAAAQVHQGGLVMLNAGVLEAARAGVGADAAAQAADIADCFVPGIAFKSAKGGGVNGAVRADVVAGVFLFANAAGGEAITLAHVGQAAFVVDDETVANTAAANTRPRAGTVVDVEPIGVWVSVGVATQGA